MKTCRIFALLGVAAIAASALSTASAEPVAPVPAPVMQPTIVGPALYVSDMARSLHFYRDLLGMTVRIQFGPKDKPDVMIGFGSDPSKPCLLLLSDRSPTPRRIEHPHGFDRFVVMLEDTPALAEKLRAAGFEATPPREVHGASTMLMATDPDGYKVEIIDTRPVRH